MKPIPGFPQTFADDSGNLYSTRVSAQPRRLSNRPNAWGYPQLKVWGKSYLAHRLVAVAYLGPLPDGMQVNHIDGNKRNNAPINLEYVTPSQNQKHAYVNGLRLARFGESHQTATITDVAAEAIRNEYLQRVVKNRMPRGTATEIATRYGVTRQYVRKLGKGIGRMSAP